MGRYLLGIIGAVVLAATAAGAQTTQSFSIGPRVSSFSTDIDAASESLKVGRDNGFGLVGDYRINRFVFDFAWDHDSTDGLTPTVIFIDANSYDRDRGEVTVGYAITPSLDLQAGYLDDTYQVGGFDLFGSVLGSSFEIDHRAIVAGIHLHSDPRTPVGFHVKARGYFGSSKFDSALGDNLKTDTTGWLAEGAVEIRFGQSKWSAVPGVAWERFETSDYDLRFDTNRFFLNVVYRSR